MEFQRTQLWQQTLASTQEDPHEREREALRAQLLRSRDHATHIAAEINRSMPEYTVHDVTHVDALWQLGQVIAGDNYPMTPSEAYVFGMSVLVHDLAMGIAAYPGGEAEFAQDVRWKDAFILEYRTRRGRFPTDADMKAPDPQIADAITSALLRERHAEQAAKVPVAPFGQPEAPIFLIEDAELRNLYGELIGRIAASHWHAAPALLKEFPTRYGAPGSMPADWTVEPLRLAALLRCADAAHLDVRRAPAFLRALRRPESASDQHWSFQSRLRRPERVDDRLVFTSVQHFDPNESQAWWLAYEAVKVVDHELRAVDAILGDARSVRFAARSVGYADSPQAFRINVPTRAWSPIDARLHVTDVTGLVQKLGGEELYGHRTDVPLRELMSNGADAIMALRALRPTGVPAGALTVSLSEDSGFHWLSIRDSGIGMSESTMADALLSFGSSYWDSPQARAELPGLWSGGFRPTGKYGIGFFSVFMLGDMVRVISRRYDAAAADTSVLEFGGGLGARPMLRSATESEQMFVGGTEVSVRLRIPPTESYGLLDAREANRLWDLGELCASLGPASDVDIYIGEGASTRLVVSGGDWKSLSGDELLLRLYPALPPKSQLRLRHMAERMTDVEVDGELVGRLVIPALEDGPLRMGSAPDALVVVGGFRSGTELEGPLGLLNGLAIRAARDVAIPVVSRPALAAWATSQASDLRTSGCTGGEQAHVAEVALALGGEPGVLKVTRSARGWLSLDEVRTFASEHHVVFLLSTYQFEDIANEKDVTLDDNVLATDGGWGRLLRSGDSGFHLVRDALVDEWEGYTGEILRSRRVPQNAVVHALAEGWGLDGGSVIDKWYDRLQAEDPELDDVFDRHGGAIRPTEECATRNGARIRLRAQRLERTWFAT